MISLHACHLKRSDDPDVLIAVLAMSVHENLTPEALRLGVQTSL
jgi:hypothetical protein